MPDRVVLGSALALWAGATLVLAELRWFRRPSLAERLRPYSPATMAGTAARPRLSAESFREVIEPLSRAAGERLARLFGVSEELAIRLRRVHSSLDVTAFRTRQLGWTAAGLGCGTGVAAAVRPPATVSLLLVVGTPLLAFLLVEQRLAKASERWRRSLYLELPVVSEQLAMLLSAGFSLGGALNRLAERSQGACGRDLRRVCGRIRQGLSEVDALREWAGVARVDAVDRLVPVLALNHEASDLGRLISDEARAIRRDVQRELVETMERRGQQVWIPVTVATLVPGVIFLAIPFIEALRLFSGS